MADDQCNAKTNYGQAMACEPYNPAERASREWANAKQSLDESNRIAEHAQAKFSSAKSTLESCIANKATCGERERIARSELERVMSGRE